MKNKRNGINIDSGKLIWICMLVGLACIAIQFLITSFTDISPVYSGIAVFAAYGAAAAAIIIQSKLTIYQYAEMHREITMTGAAMTNLIDQADIPAVITHDNGTIIWHNAAMASLFGVEEPMFGKSMNRFCPAFGIIPAEAENPPPYQAYRRVYPNKADK